MDITIRCDEAKIINKDEIGRIELTIIGANEDDINEAFAECERQKYDETHGITEWYNGEF